jgi:hypothetical protein
MFLNRFLLSHRRIKKRRRYERLAATSQFLNTTSVKEKKIFVSLQEFPPEGPIPSHGPTKGVLTFARE